MRVVQVIAVLVGLVAGIFFIGGLLLPTKLQIIKRGELCAPPARVFEALDTPAQIAKWSLFTREAKLPATSSDGSGAGGWVRWTSDDGKTIEWNITGQVPGREVDYAIHLGDGPVVMASGRVRATDGGRSSLALDMTLEPTSLAGRWGMMLIKWMPGTRSYGTMLAGEIGGLKSFLGESPDCAGDAGRG